VFARAYFALRMFAARFFPQSQGDSPAASSEGPLCATAGAAPLLTATAGAAPLLTATASAEVC
jgi:hypothetical protein